MKAQSLSDEGHTMKTQSTYDEERTMKTQSLSDEELLQCLATLIKRERRATNDVLACLGEIEARQLYATLGFSSLFEYLTKHHGYSESSAYRRISAARLLRRLPETENQILKGSLTLTQLTSVEKVIRHEINAQQKWHEDPHELSNTVTGPIFEKARETLKKVEGLSSFQTDQVLTQEWNSVPYKREHVQTQPDHSVRLAITFSSPQFNELKTSRDRLSHIHPDGSWADVIGELAHRHNQTPLKARTRISAALVRFVFERANHACEFKDPQTGHRCESHYQLQIDHITPQSKGGYDDVDNLRVLCRTHNLAEARRWGLLKRTSQQKSPG